MGRRYARYFFLVLEAAAIDIDVTTEIQITCPNHLFIDMKSFDNKELCAAINVGIALSDECYRVTDVLFGRAVRQEQAAWICHKYIVLKLRHVEIKDL